MKERPILFSAPLVRAILAGSKTVTRRPVKHPHIEDAAIWSKSADENGRWEFGVASGAPGRFGHGAYVRCPYGVPGDRLWGREAWGLHEYHDPGEWYRESIAGWTGRYVGMRFEVAYRAEWGSNQEACHWRPGIHMPRWASRLTLEVVSVHVERLQAITEEDARAEGVVAVTHGAIGQMEPSPPRTYRDAFRLLWDEINGERAPWASNPWVWVVAFRRVAQEARVD